MVPAVTVNAAEVAPLATVTEAGVVSRALLSETVTAVPPVGAAALKTTVQDELPALPRTLGVQDTEVSVGAAVNPPGPATVPPVPESGIAVPAADAAAVLLIAIEVETTPAAIVKLTVATAPLAIGVEFKPYATQV